MPDLTENVPMGPSHPRWLEVSAAAFETMMRHEWSAVKRLDGWTVRTKDGHLVNPELPAAPDPFTALAEAGLQHWQHCGTHRPLA